VILGPNDDAFHGVTDDGVTVLGKWGDDLLDSGSARNELYGGPGSDVIIADGRDHFANGGCGNDVILGNYLDSDQGSVLRGGIGDDTFAFFFHNYYYYSSDLVDSVVDFDPSHDQIALIPGVADSFDPLDFSVEPVEATAVVDIGRGLTFRIAGEDTRVTYIRGAGEIYVSHDDETTLLAILPNKPDLSPDDFVLIV
jgi:Ca2+-binding RTX toxin-like protein